MQIPRYGLIHNGYLFFHDTFKMVQVYKDYSEQDDGEDNEFFVDGGIELGINTTYRYLELTYREGADLNQVPYLQIVGENPEPLEPGSYELYPIYYFNDIPCIISRQMREYMFCMYYVDGLDKNYLKKVDNRKWVGDKQIGDTYFIFALKGDYIPDQDLKTGVTEQKADNKELVDWLISTNMIYPLEDKWDTVNYPLTRLDIGRTNYKSENRTVYRREMEDVYVDGSTYAMQVIDTLKKAYPEILFFATPSDWNKNKTYKNRENNQRSYQEWIRYTVMQEDYTQARRDFFTQYGPVILNVKMKIEFEYAALDTIKFRQRRADLILDQFITYYARDHITLKADIVGDGSNIRGFAINWNKDEALYGEQQKGSQAIETELDVHTMRFQCELFFTVLRFIVDCPPILKGFFNTFDKADESKAQSYKFEREATQKEKEKAYVKEKEEKGNFLIEKELINIDELDSESSESNKFTSVDVIHPDYKEYFEPDIDLPPPEEEKPEPDDKPELEGEHKSNKDKGNN